MTDASPWPPGSLTTPQWHVFVSPHYDDIALSCGGTVALLARAGREVMIPVVFGAPPAAPFTPFAAAQHARWGVTADTVLATRQAEEARAAALLGATSAPLRYADAIYRGERYLDDAQLFGDIARDEAALPAAIALDLTSFGTGRGTRYYVPLGVGQHVDHQLCFEAGRALARHGHEVWCYEDQPYAVAPEATGKRLAALIALPDPPRLSDVVAVPVAGTWETKLESIFAYSSQVPNIFRRVSPTADRGEIAAAMARAAASDDGVAERYWRFVADATDSAPGKNALGSGY